MKREILCSKCGTACLKSSLKEGGVRAYLGRTKFAMVCDSCNAPLLQGVIAFAFSWFDDPNRYYHWEDEFLTGKLAQGGI